MSLIASLSLVLTGETKDIETQVQDANGAMVAIGWRLRRVSSADVGAILAPMPPDPKSPTPAPADPLEGTKKALGVVCASVVAVQMPGQAWAPITLTMDDEPDEGASRFPIALLGMARIKALSEAVSAMTMEGGDVLARFLGGRMAPS